MSESMSTDGVRLRDRLRDPDARVELLLFRVGAEQFAVALSAVEEALDLAGATVHDDVPGRASSLLGVLDLRGALVPLHRASALLGLPASPVETALVMRVAGGRLALGVDDAEDVLTVRVGDLRPAPHLDASRALLGVVQQGKDLIGVLDGEVLVAACRPDPSLETS
ncbi:MAG TPA: chemotaxis protein CheW [Gemmatimonadaceae bacterium]|nr:chemotaxis protein CheW [Gemmatimonadaceae bacterium]